VTPELTPEWIAAEIKRADHLCEMDEAINVEGNGERLRPWLMGIEALNPQQYRALLAIAQRAGETCEWVREDWANFKGAQFQTNCGKKIHAEHDKSRPCWCGRTVAVRDGRT
jgi:hypothetical protein